MNSQSIPHTPYESLIKLIEENIEPVQESKETFKMPAGMLFESYEICPVEQIKLSNTDKKIKKVRLIVPRTVEMGLDDKIKTSYIMPPCYMYILMIHLPCSC